MNATEHFVQCLETHNPKLIAIDDTSGTILTYEALVNEICNLSDWLRQFPTAGVAVMLDNGPGSIVADIALLLSGHWCLPIPPFFSHGQITHAIVDSGCHFILTSESVSRSVFYGELIGRCCAGGKAMHLYQLPTASDVKLPAGTRKVTYTSGSTGNPKGLCLSDQHILNRVYSVAECLCITPPFRHLSLLPWQVLLENIAGHYACLAIGATCITPALASIANSAKKYDMTRISQLIVEYQVNSTILVPELLRQYLQHLRSHPHSLENWQFIAVGGATVPAALHAESSSLGLPVYEGFGLSEAASVVSLNTPYCVRRSSVGKVVPGVGVSIAGDGEVMLDRASFLGVAGCTNKPAEPFPTGDIGSIDEDGFVYIEGRKKTLIVTSMGRNVAPEWIESEVVGAPGIQQAFVYADHNDQLAMLVVADTSIADLDVAVRNAMSALPGYAKIQHWASVEAFTVENGLLTGTGKLDRGNLLSLALVVAGNDIDNHVNHSYS